MQDINAVLLQNSFPIRSLLRRYGILGEPTMDSIQKGFARHGDNFMMKVLQIITPQQSSYTNLLTPRSGLINSSQLDTTILQPMGATADTGSKTWNFWDKLLNGINATGEAIGKLKTNVAGNNEAPVITPQATQQAAQDASQTKTLYMVAAAFVAIIILILIFK